jgi:hypothetical protein
MSISRDHAAGLAAVFAVTLAPAARGQVGSGWEQYQPSSTIQLDGADGIESSPGSTTSRRNEGASYNKAGDVETFTLFDPISNRSERRMRNEYTSGRWQFEGEVRVSPPTNNESIMQIFGGRSPATTQMIRAYDSGGGTIRKIPGSATLATGVHGRWVRINVIHDSTSGRAAGWSRAAERTPTLVLACGIQSNRPPSSRSSYCRRAVGWVRAARAAISVGASARS